MSNRIDACIYCCPSSSSSHSPLFLPSSISLCMVLISSPALRACSSVLGTLPTLGFDVACSMNHYQVSHYTDLDLTSVLYTRLSDDTHVCTLTSGKAPCNVSHCHCIPVYLPSLCRWIICWEWGWLKMVHWLGLCTGSECISMAISPWILDLHATLWVITSTMHSKYIPSHITHHTHAPSSGSLAPERVPAIRGCACKLWRGGQSSCSRQKQLCMVWTEQSPVIKLASWLITVNGTVHCCSSNSNKLLLSTINYMDI